MTSILKITSRGSFYVFFSYVGGSLQIASEDKRTCKTREKTQMILRANIFSLFSLDFLVFVLEVLQRWKILVFYVGGGGVLASP